MPRKLLVKSAQYWYDEAKSPMPVPAMEAHARIMAMEQALNHTESALSYILDNCPMAKAIFEKVEKKK